jgi:tetratricopeptide (TPR) repeat protein
MLARTVSGALIFVVGTAAVLFWSGSRDEAYRAGDPVEGLTATLARDIPDDYPRFRMEDVASSAGIEFRHFSGTRSSKLPEDMGSGAAWGDYDRDGWVDLYVVNQAGPLGGEPSLGEPAARAALYHNLGDGTFEEVAERAGVGFDGQGMGAAWADADNDGLLDLVVTAYGEIRLYRNAGDGTFSDVSAESGLGGRDGFWTGVSWADYDRDGRVDLYVTAYVLFEDDLGEGMASQYDADVPSSLNPSSFLAQGNLLFHNEGGFRFTERAEAAGVVDARGRGLEAAWVDVDEDGWPDLYVANDVSDNVLFRNRGDGTFEDISHRALVADYRGAMGIAVGDWDGDLDQDLFITHWIAQENALYSNLLNQLSRPEDGPERLIQFRDDADRFGLGQIALDYVGWGTSFSDFDNDGRPDLFVANGSTFQTDEDPTQLEPMRDQLFWNAGRDRGFFDISPVLGAYFLEEHVGRGSAVADYDRDGDLDVFVVQHSGRAVLLGSEGVEGSWLQVELEGTESNRDAIGARVLVFAGDGPRLGVVGAQSSYLSQNELTLHFGLGGAARYDSVTISWPSGARDSFEGGATGRRIRLVEGQEGVEVVARATVMSDRERVQRFWEVFRAATRDRIAGRLEEARTGYEQASNLNPEHEDALYYWGHVALDLDRPVEARGAWERLARVNPMSSRAHVELGKLHICGSNEIPLDPGAATEEFDRALEINSEETGPLLLLAMAAVADSDWNAATRRIDDVLGSNPRSVPAVYLQGYVAWSRGDRDAARTRYEEARGLNTAVETGPQASREGDTEAGAAALTVTGARCQPLATPWSDLDGEASSAASYGRLDAWLNERRPG